MARRIYAGCFRGSLWFLCVLEGPTWRSLPGSPAPQESLWHHMVLFRPPEGADAAFKPIREFRKPLLEVIAPMPYTAMQSLFDALVPPGLQWHWKGHFVNRPSKLAINRHLAAAALGVHLAPGQG
jgi:hypothetical protein